MERTECQLPLLYRIIPPCILALATTIAYYPSLHYDFQFDDIANITKHFDIRHYALKDLFFSGTRWVIYWLNSLHYKIGKFNPFSYRIGNLIIHTANGILVFFVLLTILTRLTKPSFFKRNAFSLSFLTSLLFLLHPVQTQTVSYVIQGELEGLSSLFMLSMALCFLLFNYTKNSIRYVALFLYFTFAFFSTGTKEIAIVSPALIVLIDWFFIARASLSDLKKRIWLHTAAFFTVFSAYLHLLKPKFFVELFGLQMAVGNNIGNIITPDPNQMITPLHFCISQFKVILHYLWIFIWPFNISVEYDWVLSKSFFSPDCFFPFMALVTIVFFIFKILQKNPTNIIGFCALWFAILMAPRASIMPSPELMADYKTYLASMGWLMILAAAIIYGAEWFTQSYRSKKNLEQYQASYAFVLLLACSLGFAIQKRNIVWRSGLDFWANIVENAPGKARAYNNYAVELSQKLGKFAESIPYFKYAISMDEKYRDPYNNLAVAYAATHQLDLAIETLQKSLQINKFYPEAYNNIASFLIEKKDFEQAKRALDCALQLRPHYGKAYFNLGRIYLEEGEHEKACECFKTACTKADLDNEAGFFGYAKCCVLLKKYDEAIWAFKNTLECNPTNDDAEFNLANCYFMSERWDEAEQAYKALIAKNPLDPKFWYNLAETYYSAGRIDQALYCFEKIRKDSTISPNLFIRIAACHEQLGNPRQAKSSLQELLSKRQLNENDQKTVHAAMSKLNQKYGLS